MRSGWARVVLVTVLLSCAPLLAVEGMFQGRVVDPPYVARLKPGWIYVQGRNHSLRRVEVAHAAIVFGEEVPASQQHRCHMECIEVGQEVRVYAEQDSKGEWRAKRVEIVRLVTNRA
ncbi:MAG TPA: hypothetical protein VN679_01615 [Candidatus Acidoferrales bacterium]|jgi:hypothetical protein|nr:hypothetical protein [Candidatus Acidoferrales bacterium]